MAMVASLDFSNYLQVVSPPTWIGQVSQVDSHVTTSRCAMAHGHSSVDLLRSVHELNTSSCCHDDRSRDVTSSAGAPGDCAAVDSGYDSSEDTSSQSSSSSTSLRSTSLKRVWFADDVGLSLVTVRYYDVQSATQGVEYAVPASQTPAYRRRSRLEAAFRQPWLDPAGLRGQLDRDAVALESTSIRGRGLTFAGTVLVANLEFEKRVTVRCTYDCWQSHIDVPAVYVTTGSPGTDLFAFEVQPDSRSVADEVSSKYGDDRVEFAVRYQYRAHSDDVWTERWDNNAGLNYQMMSTCLGGV